MNILYFIADQFKTYNSSRWRVSSQAKLLREHAHHFTNVNTFILSVAHWQRQTTIGISHCAWADVIVLQRTAINLGLKHIRLWRDAGKVIVLDYDDDYFRIPNDNTAYQFWGEGRRKNGSKIIPHPIEQLKEGISIVDAVSAPSKLLLKDAKLDHGARDIRYIPNFIDLDLMPEPNTNTNSNNEKILFVWGGSMSHVRSWKYSGILEATREILKHRDNVEFRIFGDGRIMEMIDRVIDHNHKHMVKFLPYVPYYQWGRTLQQNGDVGLAPLAGQYDCRRSNIKTIEYKCLGMPFVASKSTSYLPDLQDKNTDGEIFIDQGDTDKLNRYNAQGWTVALNKVIDNFENYKKEALKMVPYYRDKYGLNPTNAKHVVDCYRTLILKKKGYKKLSW